ncbi:MAG: 2Fe-2S iron-sulfur cluster-binding protein [Gammaproteobacteria bacterium]
MSSKKITVSARQIDCQPGESLLDAFVREKIDIPYACREGACQSCMVQSLGGSPPPEAQKGLKDVLQHQNYFLACLCIPHEDMTIAIGPSPASFTEATVIGKELLNQETLLLTIELAEAMDYYAGQFVNLKRNDGLIRSYSIANSRVHAHKLTFHIRRLTGGHFSEWAHQELAIGDRIAVSDPQGLCYYLPNNLEQNMLLIGTGSGLAPLAGIIEEALHHGHRGEIYLYHGSREIDGLYWIDEMRELEAQYANFHYSACVSRGEAPEGIAQGRANAVALSELSSLRDWRVFLCGHPDMVHQAKRDAFLKGASFQNIYSDAFHVASPTLD